MMGEHLMTRHPDPAQHLERTMFILEAIDTWGAFPVSDGGLGPDAQRILKGLGDCFPTGHPMEAKWPTEKQLRYLGQLARVDEMDFWLEISMYRLPLDMKHAGHLIAKYRAEEAGTRTPAESVHHY